MRQEKDGSVVAGWGAILVVAVFAIVAGCSNSGEKANLRDHPDITVVDHVDDCEVKYVNHGEKSLSYFLAKCGDTATISQHYKEASHATAPTVERTQIIKNVTKTQEKTVKQDGADIMIEQAQKVSIDILLDN